MLCSRVVRTVVVPYRRSSAPVGRSPVNSYDSPYDTWSTPGTGRGPTATTNGLRPFSPPFDTIDEQLRRERHPTGMGRFNRESIVDVGMDAVGRSQRNDAGSLEWFSGRSRDAVVPATVTTGSLVAVPGESPGGDER